MDCNRIRDLLGEAAPESLRVKVPEAEAVVIPQESDREAEKFSG